MTERATLIWHRDIAKVWYRDWLRFLLSDVIQEELVDLAGTICRPYSIVLEDNRSRTPATFFERAAEQRPVGLLHIADEYFRFDYRKYNYFDFVMKIYWSPVFTADRILVLPLGYGPDLPFGRDWMPASRRPLLWSFAGQLKASRYEMVRALSDIQPNAIILTAGVPSPAPHPSKRQHVELLQDTVFSPCPMGNVVIETRRLYESLEAGCIPIVEKRPFLRYYENLLDDPPFIFIWNWTEAKQRILELADDPIKLDRTQHETHEWWERFKRGLKERVTAFVDQGFSRPAGPTSRGVRVKRVAELPGWRYAELLRHQSLQSLRWRIRRNLLRGRLRVPF